MNSKEIVVSKKTVYAIALVLVALVAVIVYGGKFSILGFGKSDRVDSSNLVAGSSEKFGGCQVHCVNGKEIR
jgi:hypothetical protein